MKNQSIQRLLPYERAKAELMTYINSQPGYLKNLTDEKLSELYQDVTFAGQIQKDNITKDLFAGFEKAIKIQDEQRTKRRKRKQVKRQIDTQNFKKPTVKQVQKRISTLFCINFKGFFGNNIFNNYTSWNACKWVIFGILIFEFIGYLITIIWELCCDDQRKKYSLIEKIQEEMKRLHN